MKITGKDLKRLGFKKQKDDSDFSDPFHYYIYDIDGTLLISCANTDKKNGGYYVEFFNTSVLRYSELEDLEQLIQIIRIGLINNKHKNR